VVGPGLLLTNRHVLQAFAAPVLGATIQADGCSLRTT
jgi:hypothetical protein